MQRRDTGGAHGAEHDNGLREAEITGRSFRRGKAPRRTGDGESNRVASGRYGAAGGVRVRDAVLRQGPKRARAR